MESARDLSGNRAATLGNAKFVGDCAARATPASESRRPTQASATRSVRCSKLGRHAREYGHPVNTGLAE
jgi:hypothetical protein